MFSVVNKLIVKPWLRFPVTQLLKHWLSVAWEKSYWGKKRHLEKALAYQWYPQCLLFLLALFIFPCYLQITGKILRWPWLGMKTNFYLPCRTTLLTALAPKGTGCYHSGIPAPALLVSLDHKRNCNAPAFLLTSDTFPQKKLELGKRKRGSDSASKNAGELYLQVYIVFGLPFPWKTKTFRLLNKSSHLDTSGCKNPPFWAPPRVLLFNKSRRLFIVQRR